MENKDQILIKFISPQIESEWTYCIEELEDKLVLKPISLEKNIFLEAITKVFFSFFKTQKIHIPKKNIEVLILNDPEFYSKDCIKTFHEKFPIFEKTNLKKTGINYIVNI